MGVGVGRLVGGAVVGVLGAGAGPATAEAAHPHLADPAHVMPEVGQTFLDEAHHTKIQLFSRFGILRQSVPDCCFNNEIRDSVVSSFELALQYGLPKHAMSVLVTVPVGFEHVDGSPVVWLFGNIKLGVAVGQTFALHPDWSLERFTEAEIRGGYEPRSSLSLGVALEAYLPTATGPSPDDCGRPFCRPMENLRSFRPEESQLWTNDSWWFRVRGGGDLQYSWFRLSAQGGLSLGITTGPRQDPVGLGELALGLAFQAFSWVDDLRSSPAARHVASGFQVFSEVAWAGGFGEPNDRLFPASPGLDAFFRALDDDFTPDNDLSFVHVRAMAGLRYFFGHTPENHRVPFVGLFATWDLLLSQGIPMVGVELGFTKRSPRVTPAGERREDDA